MSPDMTRKLLNRMNELAEENYGKAFDEMNKDKKHK